MNIYKISQNVNNDYDTYDSAVICAEDEVEAKNIHPDGTIDYPFQDKWSTWANRADINVEYIGVADEKIQKGVICSSFNAG